MKKLSLSIGAALLAAASGTASAHDLKQNHIIVTGMFYQEYSGQDQDIVEEGVQIKFNGTLSFTCERGQLAFILPASNHYYETQLKMIKNSYMYGTPIHISSARCDSQKERLYITGVGHPVNRDAYN